MNAAGGRDATMTREQHADDQNGMIAVPFVDPIWSGIEAISDEMRAVVESDWPELAHELPPHRQTQRV